MGFSATSVLQCDAVIASVTQCSALRALASTWAAPTAAARRAPLGVLGRHDFPLSSVWMDELSGVQWGAVGYIGPRVMTTRQCFPRGSCAAWAESGNEWETVGCAARTCFPRGLCEAWAVFKVPTRQFKYNPRSEWYLQQV